MIRGNRVGRDRGIRFNRRVILLGGALLTDPVLFSGPFVMDTPQRLAQAKRDFVSGKMGVLDGVPF